MLRKELNESPQRSYSLKTCSSSATVVGLKYNSSILVLGGHMGNYLHAIYWKPMCTNDCTWNVRSLYSSGFLTTTASELSRYRSLNAILAQLKKFPIWVNATMELKNITTISDSTGTLISWDIHPDAIVVGCSYIFDRSRNINPNGHVWIVPLLYSVSNIN